MNFSALGHTFHRCRYLAVAFPIAVGAAWTVAIGLPRTRLLQVFRHKT